MFDKPTYGAAQLDYFLLSESLVDVYCVTDCPPIDKSAVPHIFLLASPLISSQRNKNFFSKRFLFEDIEC